MTKTKTLHGKQKRVSYIERNKRGLSNIERNKRGLSNIERICKH